MGIPIKKHGQRLCSFKPEAQPQVAIVEVAEFKALVTLKRRRMTDQQISNIQFNLHREAKRRIAQSH